MDLKVDEIDFKLVLRFLKQEGWKWKAAGGLEYGTVYIKPGCKGRGVRGVDSFTGETELLEYIKKDKELCRRVFPLDSEPTSNEEPSRKRKHSDVDERDMCDAQSPRTRPRAARQILTSFSRVLSPNSPPQHQSSDHPLTFYTSGDDVNTEEGVSSVSSTRIVSSVHTASTADVPTTVTVEGETAVPDPRTPVGRRPHYLDFDYAHHLDPNVGGDEEVAAFLESDDEAVSIDGESRAFDEVGTDSDDDEDAHSDDLPNHLTSPNPDIERRVQDSATVFGNEELKEMAKTGWDVCLENVARPANLDADIDALYDGYHGPSEDILLCRAKPLDLFLYFLPRSFWKHVGTETHRYWDQTLEQRVHEAVQSQGDSQPPRSPSRWRAKLRNFARIQPCELLHWVGLLVGRALAPKKRLSDHWKTAERGVIPAGTFGEVMSRDRFKNITRFIHFADNKSPKASLDKAWKLRPVLATLEQTFESGYLAGAYLSIDEGMLPSRNRHNPTRTYLKDKPHKWGTKCVLTCCASTGYCLRTELDVGKKRLPSDEGAVITQNGPAAIVRNLTCLFSGKPYEGRRIVVADRFYTSVPLVQQLRKMGFHYCGTIQVNRRGWCKSIEFDFTKRPRSVQRGTFRMATARSDPGVVALSWADNNVVNFLASHMSTDITTIDRREKNGSISKVVCPKLVLDYQTYMGGVDKHDQLRLHSYSLQLSTRFRKYYLSLFLGLLDMAIVNAYIVLCWIREKKQKQKKPTHQEFMAELHEGLIQVTERDFTSTTSRQAANLVGRAHRGGIDPNLTPPLEHGIRQIEDRRTNGGVSRLRQRQCRVCAVLAHSEHKRRGGTTTWYCPKCSANQRGLYFLCNKIRNHPSNPGLTCSQIYHLVWKNGEFAPTDCRTRDRRLRTTGSRQ